MADIELQIAQLVRQATYLPDGAPAKIQLLEEAIQLADSHQRVELQYQTRLELLSPAVFSGYTERAITAFTWCLGQIDQDPQRFPIENVLWNFKHILEDIADYPQISRQQIDSMFEDMHKRYHDAGYSVRPVYTTRAKTAARMGEIAAVVEYVEEMQRHPRDYFADCAACELHMHVESLAIAGRYAEAVQQAGPILSGRMGCAEVPHVTYAHLLMPLLHLGREDQAAEYHRTGYRLVSENRAFLLELAQHMVYLVQVGEWARGLEMFERHLPWAMTSAAVLQRLQFYLASLSLLERLAAGEQRLKLRLPQDFALYRQDGDYALDTLCTWFLQQCETLAAQFDDRNGNDYYRHALAARHRPVMRGGA